MRVLHLVHELNRLSAGVGVAAIDLHRALLEYGVDSYISGIRGPGSEELLEGISSETYHTYSPPLLLRRYGPTAHISKLIAAKAPQVIHIHGLWQFSSLVGLYESRRRAVIVSPHGMLDSWALKQPSIQKRVAWRIQDGKLLRRAAAVHCLTDSEVQAVKRLGIARPTPVVPNALIFDDCKPPSLPPKGMKTMLFLGRLHPKKNLEGLVRAWGAAKSDGSVNAAKWRLQLVGGGEAEYVSKISDLISGLGLENQVTIVGPLYGPDKEQALDQATAFILPSFSEGLPMAVLEAWRSQCLVLMSDECNLGFAFEAGAATRTGTDVKDIARALTSVFESSDSEIERSRLVGFEYAKSRYDWSEVVSNFQAMYAAAEAAS